MAACGGASVADGDDDAGSGGAPGSGGSDGSAADAAGDVPADDDAAGDVVAGDDAADGPPGDPDELSADQLALLGQHFAPLPAQPPASPTNRWADNPAAAALGQKLFFLTGYASTLKVDGPNGIVGQTAALSCATCHEPEKWFIDPRSPLGTSHGVTWTERNSPSLVNAAYNRFFSWAGKQDSIWMQGANSMESSANFGGNRLQYVHLIYSKFRAEYDALFPVPLDPALAPGAPDAARFPASGKPKRATTDPDGAWETMAAADREIINVIISNTGKALEAYQRKLISRNSPFERYLTGERNALTGQQKRGLKLFIGAAGCASCHSGPSLTNDEFANIGVPQMAEHALTVDLGRYDDGAKLLTDAFNGAGGYSDDKVAGMAKLSQVVARQEADRGAFRVTMLWNVATTAPYFHNGGVASLEEVVHFYNLGGGENGYSGVKDARAKPLNLTPAQEAELVAFLESLTGEPVAAALRVNPLAP